MATTSLLGILFAVLSACAASGVNNNPAGVTIPMLNATIEPCAPIEGSSVDPCLKDNHERLIETCSRHAYVHGRPYTLSELYDLADAPGSLGAPLFTVRGTFVPGTARCVVTAVVRDMSIYEGYPGTPATPSPSVQNLECVIDMRVAEYITGNGASSITVYGYPYLPSADPRDAAGGIEYLFAGKEWIVWLGKPWNISVLAWDRFGVWYVERDGDDVAVVAPDAHSFPTDAGYSDLRYTLPEFRTQMAEMFAAKRGATSASSEPDPLLPDIVTEVSLRDLAVAQGALDYPNIGFALLPTVRSDGGAVGAIETPTPTPTPTAE